MDIKDVVEIIIKGMKEHAQEFQLKLNERKNKERPYRTLFLRRRIKPMSFMYKPKVRNTLYYVTVVVVAALALAAIILMPGTITNEGKYERDSVTVDNILQNSPEDIIKFSIGQTEGNYIETIQGNKYHANIEKDGSIYRLDTVKNLYILKRSQTANNVYVRLNDISDDLTKDEYTVTIPASFIVTDKEK